MKTWRERIAEAEARAGRWYAWPMRLARAMGVTWCWPFTHDDDMAWGDPLTCPAGEMRSRYGLHWLAADHLYTMGTHQFGPPMFRGDTRRCAIILARIEDRALELKREPAPTGATS